MADQKKWFKVWTTLLIDSLSNSIENIGRFTVLGCLIASRGENGKLVTDKRTLQTLLQCNEIPTDFIRNFNIIIEEIEGNSNGGLSVTLKNWNKYQVDSTGYDRIKRYRERQSVTANVTANDNAFVTEQEKIRLEKIRLEKIRLEKIRLEKKIIKKHTPKLSDKEWMQALKNNPAYTGINIEIEHNKCIAWFENKGITVSRQRFLNWLNRTDKPLKKGETYGTEHKNNPDEYSNIGRTVE